MTFNIEFVSIVLLTVCMTSIIVWITYIILRKKSILDIPNHRSSHEIPTPRGGGIAVGISLFCVIFYLYYTNQIDPRLAIGLGSGIGIMMSIGFLEDTIGVPIILRLVCQTLSSLFAIWSVFGCSLSMFEWIIGSIGCIWIINLFNFMDGINGILTLESIFVLWSSSFIMTRFGSAFCSPYLPLLMGASFLGFLPFNFPKARLFMGDSGSYTAGFSVAFILLILYRINIYCFLSGIILCGLFFVDSTYTLIKRWTEGDSVWSPHKSHSYQLLTLILKDHTKVALLYWGINGGIILPAAYYCTVYYSSWTLFGMYSILFSCAALIRYRFLAPNTP